MKISKLLPSLALVTAVIATSSCGKLEDRINSLEQRISELENTRIPSIDEQVASIKKTIGELEKTDAGLREYISALEEKQATLETELGKTNAALTEAQKTLREEMAADKTELSGSVDAAKADVIAQLEAYKTLMSGELETLNGTIESLKAKDEELQKNAEELRGYVDSENGKVRDWADATFATIEQQNKLAETVASIKTQFETLNNYTMNMDVRLTNKAEELSKSLSALDESTSQQIGALTEKLGSDISALRTELTDAYTKLVATEITRLETSMKSWVSEQLAGYYTIEQADAKLEAMRTELTGRMDSDKAYLTTLITNLETATNRKISANAGLITGLRGDLTSLSQSVAENAGKIADDAILISQNTADISKNSTAIAANTKNLAAVKKLAEDNQKLITENNDKLGEMQRLVNELKDKEIANLETIAQNTQDIASNASLIAKNAASIQSNAAAIAQNASDIQALQRKLDATETELVEAYTAAIAKAINDYDGTITAKLASGIAKVDEKIKTLNSEIESIKSRLSNLEDRVSKIEDAVSMLQSISVIPTYSDGSVCVKRGLSTIKARLLPLDVAKRFVEKGTSAFSLRVVAVQTKSTESMSDVAIESVVLRDDIIEVSILGSLLPDGLWTGNENYCAALSVSDGNTEKSSSYFSLYPLMFEYVDLGLSVKWATCNVGAVTPEDYGDYFAWGETEPYYENGQSQSASPQWLYGKTGYNWDSYKWYNKEDASIIKYRHANWDDSMPTLQLEDDAANCKLGGKWRLPSADEWRELRRGCSWKWTSFNGISGYIVTGKKTGYTGNSIFLPASGRRTATDLSEVGDSGVYWSCSLGDSKSEMASDVIFSDVDFALSTSAKYVGHSLRPVYVERHNHHLERVEGVIPTETDSGWNDYYKCTETVNPCGTYFCDSDGTTIGNAAALKAWQSEGGAGYLASSGEYVDFGLSVVWAKRNVGASTVEESGDYFAWGETEPKKVYDWNTYVWAKDYYHLIKYNTENKYGVVDNKTRLELEDDAAHVKLGGEWRMPSYAEWEDLFNNCDVVRSSLNGVVGFKVVGKISGYTDRMIFFPSRGYKASGMNDIIGCYYWSSSSVAELFSHNPFSAWAWISSEEQTRMSSADKSNGLLIRPVVDK